MRERTGRKFLIGCATTLVVVATIATGGGVGTAVWLTSGRGNVWLAALVERLGTGATRGGRLEIGTLDLGASGLTLEQVTLSDEGGRPLAQVERLAADIRWSALWSGNIHLTALRGTGVTVTISADADGVLDWARLFSDPAAPPSDEPFRLPVAFDIDSVDLTAMNFVYRTPDGTVVAGNGGVSGRVSGRQDRVSVHDLDVTALLVEPGEALVRATGGIAYDANGFHVDDVTVQVGDGTSLFTSGSWGEAVDVHVRLDAVDFDALDPLLHAGLAGQWTGEVHATGTPSRLGLAASVAGVDRGSVRATAELDTTASPLSWKVRGDLYGFHADALFPSLTEPTVVSGDVVVGGSGTALASDLTLEGSWTGGRQQVYGYDLSAVDARFRVADGALHLEDTRLDGIIGALRLDGEIGLDGPIGLGLRVRGPLDAAMLTARGVSGVGGAGTVDVVVHGELTGDNPPIEITGTVEYAPFVYGDVRATTVSVPFALTVRGSEVEGTLALTATDVASAGITAASAHSEALTLVSGRSGTSLDGPLRLENVTSSDAVVVHSAVGTCAVRVDEHVAVDVGFELGSHAVFGFPGTVGTLTLKQLDDALDVQVRLQDGPRTTLALDGAYDRAAARVTLDTLELAPTRRARWTSQRPVSFVVVDGGLAEADVAMSGNLGAVEWTGRIATTGAVDGQINVRDLQLDVLAELFPETFDALGGTLTAAARVSGDAGAPQMVADLHVRGLNIEGTVRAMDVEGTVTLADNVLVPNLALAAAHVPMARIEGRVPLQGGLAAPDLDWDAPGRLSVDVLPGPSDRLRDLTPLADAVTFPNGRFSGSFEVSGPFRDPDLRFAGVAETDLNGWDRPARIELTADRRGEQLHTHVDLRQDLYERASIDATARTQIGTVFAALAAGLEPPSPTAPDQLASDLHAEVQLHGVPAASVGALLGLSAPLLGSVTGRFDVTGSASTPVVNGAMSWTDAVVGRQPLDRVLVSLAPRNEGPGYTVHAEMADPGGGFTLDGEVPLRVDLTSAVDTWPAGEMSIDVRGDMPLALFEAALSDVRRADGRLALSGHIGGSPLSPSADLSAQVDGGRVIYRPLGVEARDLVLALAVTDQTLTLTRAAAVLTPFRTRTLDGSELHDKVPDGGPRPRVVASGRAQLDDGGVFLEGDLRLTDGPWLVAADEATLRADGRVSAEGKWPDLRVRGELEVVQGAATINTAELAAAAPLVLDPSISVTRTETDVTARAPLAPPFYAAFDVDVTLDLKRNLELTMSVPVFDQFGRIGADLTATDISARLGGRLSAQLESGQPTLVGEVELLGGQVRMLRSTFDLDRGTITWAGGDPYEDAVLDIHAVANVPGGGSLSLNLTGTAAEPDPPALSSEEYPDANQQMAILLTGRAPEDLTSLEGAAELVAQTLLSNVFGGRSLGSVSFEPDGSVRIGIPVTPTFHAATLFCPLCWDPESNQLTIQGEWSILPRLVLSGAYGNNTSWGDVFWETRF